MNDKLKKIQAELKAPKSEFNSFAKFSYRSAEKILEAVKPLVHAEGLTLYLSDEVVNVGDANYVKATATLDDGENRLWVHAYAREEVSLKGQIAAQITGGASSYARKYALSGLFAIDDTEDVDSKDNSKIKEVKQAPKTNKQKLATMEQRQAITNELELLSIFGQEQAGYLVEQYGVDIPLTEEGADFVLKQLTS